MKDIYKNPTLYYILVPIVIALWPLLIWSVSLPKARAAWNSEITQYEKAQKVIEEVLNLDPDRLDFASAKTGAAEFDYASAVEKVASLYKIPPTNYKLTSGIIITSAGKKSQTARVTLKGINVAQFTNFLSTIQLRWSNLQCTQLKLTKKKDSPDSWDADLDLKYFF